MGFDRKIWDAARHLMSHHGAGAADIAAERFADLLKTEDADGQLYWLYVLAALRDWTAESPEPGVTIH